MSDNNRSRPAFIRAINVTNMTMTGNTVRGNADFAELENITGLVAHDNKHITQDQISASPNKRWFEKPIGIVFLGLVVTVGGGGVLYYLGWL
jgi:hypothetical protein